MKAVQDILARVACVLLSGIAIVCMSTRGRANQPGAGIAPTIPKTWDDAAVAALEVPLANAAYSPVHVSSDIYYRLPVRPVYKSYPIYAPGREPAGYILWLQQQDPEVVFDASTLKTEADWIRAGELVFDAPASFFPRQLVRNPEVYAEAGTPLTPEGIMPFQRYVVRTKG